MLRNSHKRKRQGAGSITEVVWEDFSKYEKNWQQPTLFDLPEIEPKLQGMPYYPVPKNDNERLFNLQHDYYNGDKEALSKMFLILKTIAPKLVNIESKSRHLLLPKQRMEELGEEAVMIFIECVLKKHLVIKKSFIAYLRLQVLRALFYQTKSAKFEKWLIDNKICITSIDSFDAQWEKELFERELEEERKEREENK